MHTDTACSHCGTIDFLPMTYHGSAYCEACYKIQIADNASSDTSSATTRKMKSVKTIFKEISHRHDELLPADQKEHLNIKSSNDVSTDGDVTSIKSLQRLNDLDTKSDKQMKMKNKTKEILLKAKAEGNEEISAMERFYFIATFVNSKETIKCFFVNRKNATVGHIIEYVANHFPHQAFGKVSRPSDMTLTFTETENTGKSSIDWSKQDLIANVLEPMCTLEFSPISVSEAVRIQDEYMNTKESTKEFTKESSDKKEMDIAEIEQNGKQDIKEENVEMMAMNSEENTVTCMQSEDIKEGSLFLYKKEGVEVIVTCRSIHRDDFPALYFTVVSDDGRERQTTAQYLFPLRVAAASSQKDLFTVNIACGSKKFTLDISESMQVGLLKAMIVEKLKVDTSKVNKVKLITKGQILSDNNIAVKDTKIVKDCKISVMGVK